MCEKLVNVAHDVKVIVVLLIISIQVYLECRTSVLCCLERQDITHYAICCAVLCEISNPKSMESYIKLLNWKKEHVRMFGPVRFAEKPWLKVLFINLL